MAKNAKRGKEKEYKLEIKEIVKFLVSTLTFTIKKTYSRSY